MIQAIFLNLIEKYCEDQNYNLQCWAEIEGHYTTESRYYHNLYHIANMMEELNPVKSRIGDLDTLLFAIFYHDIIYQPTETNNEHKSALLFNKRVSKTSFANLDRAMAHIEATKTHQVSLDNDTNYLLDLDLAILGKSARIYGEYCNSIRKEFKMYSDSAYRKGRAKALNHFLKMDSIYKTEFFQRAYETQAINNLKWELRKLTLG